MKSNTVYRSVSCLLLLFAAQCKKSEPAGVPNGYFRFISIDYKTLFYWDKKINANGDSILFNTDGTIYGRTSSARFDLLNTPSISYAAGGCNDNSNLDNPGAYGYVQDINGGNGAVTGYAYFPNPTLRIPLAPIVSGYNLLNWAALPAGSHELSFRTALPTVVNGIEVASRIDSLLLGDYVLEAGALQTLFLINRSEVKTLSGRFPFYSTDGIGAGESYTSIPGVVSIKDHPDQFKFKDSSAYIRFLNFTPPYFAPGFNQTTERLDIYLTPVDAQGRDGRDTLVAKNIGRFESTVDQPFYEIPLNSFLKGDTVGKHYYRIKVYQEGQSQAGGFIPLGNSLLPIFNIYDNVAINAQGTLTRFSGVDSWLVRSDGARFFPTVNTIAFAIGNSVGGNSSLVLKSCFVYQRAGLNRRYFR